LKPCSEKVFMPFLQEHFPNIVSLYKARYADRAFLPIEYKKRISALVKKLCRLHGIAVRDESHAGILGKEQSAQLTLFTR